VSVRELNVERLAEVAPPLLVAAVILLCAGAVSAAPPVPARNPPAAKTPSPPYCAECGLVDKVRESAPGKGYTVTIQFEDGSVRTVHYGGVPPWKQGDRVRMVNGQLAANG
jgi:hypothetical protein